MKERIALRAYERFLARGGEHGHDVEDWLAAEAELKEYDVILVEPGTREIELVRTIRDITGMSIAQHVPQTRVIGRAKHRCELFGRTRHGANRVEDLVTLGAL